MVYCPSFDQHLDHLRATFKILRFNQLYIKRSKCAFAQKQVEYLGHIISGAGVGTDPKKIEAVVAWSKPTNIRALRGFLGLIAYYGKFVRNYGTISKPLMKMLKKDSFKWSPQAEEAFEQLKKTLSEVSVLGLPDFNKPFVLETNANNHRIGAVLS